MKIKPGMFVRVGILCILLFLNSPGKAWGDPSEWSREQLSGAFDEVARNFGAIEYATYTYMTEFSCAPGSIDVLRESGHLNIAMTNPYTGGDVLALAGTEICEGDLVGNIGMSVHDEGHEVRVEAWYMRRDENGTLMQRSMLKRISVRVNEVNYDYMFANELPRDEQMVVVYCIQALDAIDSFIQRNGRSPEDFVDMYENGDVNVRYLNPVTGDPVVSTEELSAGDFMYRKVGEKGYTLIGWGREEPVFFGTMDEVEEMNFYVEWAELAPEEE